MNLPTFQNLRPALIITRREVRDQFRDWRILAPIIILTVFFPGLMNFTASQAVTFVQRYGADLIADRLIPFLLMVVGFFPISISLVIALESFVGEKERRSIEPLLSSPLTDGQLYLGKLLAAMVPPLIGSYLGIAVYLLGVYWQVGWMAEPVLLVQILLLTLVQAMVMVSGAVVISTQTTSVRAANLLASFIIIPMALLIQGESVIMFWAQYEVLWWVIFAQFVIAGLLMRTGISHFNREELLGRELDTLNFRWYWQIISASFVGKAKTLTNWLRNTFRETSRSLGIPALLVALLLGASFLIGASQAARFSIPSSAFETQDLESGIVQGLEWLPLFSVEGILTIWLHNLRAILIATVFGIFTFGVLGLLVVMLPIFLIGFFAASVSAIGISPGVFLGAFVLPHGVLEIPAMIIAGAAILKLGATLAAPAKNRTIMEAWLEAFVNWAKAMILFVIPLFFLAAILEVYVTPQVVMLLLGK